MTVLSFDCRHQYTAGFRLETRFTCGAGITAIVGPSGAGKSSILAIIAGLLRPDSAVVTLQQETLVDTGRGVFVPPERRGIGFVFQDDLLFPHLTVEQNLRYGARRRPRKSIDFGHVVSMLELNELLARYPATLSGGQRQRVALGRAVLRGPSMLLLDEPFNSQDVALRDRVVDSLARLLGELAIPTLLVAHDQEAVDRLAATRLTLHAGRIADLGTVGK